MNDMNIIELTKACGEFGLEVEIIETEDESGPMLILTGGFPDPETIQEINRRIALIEPKIRKILLEIADK